MSRWFSWNIAFRLQERIKGHPTFQILREMEDSDCLSPAELDGLQRERLKRFINACYDHVPYIRTRMREAGVQPPDIRGPEDLVRLPIMTKADVRTHRQELRSEISGKLKPFATGGSTGDPLIFDLSKRRIASRVACRQRVSRWWGVSIGDRELALWGSPVELTRQDTLRKLRDHLLATRLLSAFELSAATMSQYLDILEQGRFRQIFAYPSAIYWLCLHARKQGRNLRRLGVKVVFVTSEVLYPFQREVITETLNCPVANGYGGRESGFVAHECPQGGMHLMADAVMTEVVDSEGRWVPAGQPGEIVVTDLYSEEAPFLRYATGDVGVLANRRCVCGRPQPLLDSLQGRSNDSIVAPDGRIINDQALVYLMRDIPGVEQFRICQKTLNSFHVEIVRNQDLQAQGEERIRRGWTQLMRAPLEITFEYVPQLAPERSGKFRHIVSELPAGRSPQREEEPAPLLEISKG